MQWWLLWCLLVTLALLGGAIVMTRPQSLSVSSKARLSAPLADIDDTIASWVPTATRLLTRSERQAYQLLRKALPDHVMLAQVPLARFIRVPTRNSYAEWLRRVGAHCADIVICDDASHVIAVVELRLPVSKEKPRTVRRHMRMDRVLKAAGIAVHVWEQGATPDVEGVCRTVLAASSQAAIRAAKDKDRRADHLPSRGIPMQPLGTSLLSSSGEMHGVTVTESDLDPEDAPSSKWFDEVDTPVAISSEALVQTRGH